MVKKAKRSVKGKKVVEKPYKAGATVTLHFNCNYAGCEETDEYVLDFDATEEELQAIASEFAMENVQPEGWFVVKEEEES